MATFIKKYRFVLIPILIALLIIQALIHRGIIQISPDLVLGPLHIKFYSIFILIGATVVILFFEEYKKNNKNLSNVNIEDVIIFAAVPGILGARIWHLVTDWHLYQNNPIEALYIWNGGLSIFGGILGILLGIYIYTRIKKADFISIINVCAAILPLAQIIGRYGNFLNQEVFGPPLNSILGLYIRPENRPEIYKNTEFFHPSYLYEQIGNLILLLINFYLIKRYGLDKKFYIGTWLIGYGIIRFIVEFFRLGTNMLSFGVTVSQLTCLIMIVAGVIYLFLSFKFKKI